MYLLVFDPVEAQSMLAYSHLEAGHTAEALSTLEGIISSGKEFPPYVLFDAARACVLLGDKEAALAHLMSMAERGSRNAALFEGCPDFELLRGLPGWQNFIRKVHENENAK